MTGRRDIGALRGLHHSRHGEVTGDHLPWSRVGRSRERRSPGAPRDHGGDGVPLAMRLASRRLAARLPGFEPDSGSNRHAAHRGVRLLFPLWTTEVKVGAAVVRCSTVELPRQGLEAKNSAPSHRESTMEFEPSRGRPGSETTIAVGNHPRRGPFAAWWLSPGPWSGTGPGTSPAGTGTRPPDIRDASGNPPMRPA